jgi:YHS domain-containing protein
LIVAFFSGAALAQKAPAYSDAAGAIRGYDPVAYFTEGRPVKGSREFSHRWNGAQWRFASAQNRERFAAAPEKYAPQYGGYCAYGVAGGYAVKIDKKDVPGYIRKADANWPAVLAK